MAGGALLGCVVQGLGGFSKRGPRGTLWGKSLYEDYKGPFKGLLTDNIEKLPLLLHLGKGALALVVAVAVSATLLGCCQDDAEQEPLLLGLEKDFIMQGML